MLPLEEKILDKKDQLINLVMEKVDLEVHLFHDCWDDVKWKRLETIEQTMTTLCKQIKKLEKELEDQLK